MAKKIYGIFLILLIAVSFSLWYFADYQNQIHEPSPTSTPPLDVARIVSILPHNHWGNPVGMALETWFNISIHNEGANEIEDLTLNLTISGVSTEIYVWGTVTPIGTIQPNQIIEVQVYIILTHNGYENIGSVAGQNATIELILDDKILDKSQLTMPTM